MLKQSLFASVESTLFRNLLFQSIKKAFKQRLLLSYGWGTWIRTKEMPDSESGALPLGYTPISVTVLFYLETISLSSRLHDFPEYAHCKMKVELRKDEKSP